MIEEVIRELLKSAIANAEVEVQSNGNSFMLRVVSDCFEGLSSLKRQQLIYSCINDKIKSGEIHAVTMHLQTFAEHERQKRFSL